MSAPEPRSTPGRSTGTPEPSQAASEACGAESAHDGVVWEYVGDDWREKTCATCGGTGDAPSSVGMVTDCSDCEGTGHVLAASEADRGAAMDALVKRLGRVLGNVPIGTRDLVNVLTGPDVAPWTSRVLAAVSPEGGEVARLREALEQVRALWCPLCGASPAGSEPECSWCGRLAAVLESVDAPAPDEADDVTLRDAITCALVSHQRIPTYRGAEQRCSGCDHLKDATDGPNSTRHAAHQADVALAVLREKGALR